jgi:hypothetical protein
MFAKSTSDGAMTAQGRLIKLVAWLQDSPGGRVPSRHDLSAAADDIEQLLKDHARLTEICRAARRLDKALAEFGPDRAFVGDYSQTLRDLLRAHPGAGELVIEELPGPQEGRCP